jgi:LCP family protein required for cell wall assembly
MTDSEKKDELIYDIYGRKTDAVSKSKPRVVSTYKPEVPAPISNSQKGRWWRWVLLIVIIIIATGCTVALGLASNLTNKVFVGKTSSFYKPIMSLIRGSNEDTKLIGEDLGKINILLLGIGGEGHEGGYLTDTIILAQIRPDIQKVSMTSIPRDYLINNAKLGQRKINAAFAEGFIRNKDWNEAGSYARETVEEISGMKIPYFAVVDFKGFEKVVDLLGGVDVTIDRTFTDYQYPNSSYGYLPALTFKQGSEHMNGTRALQFARSRHAAGPEGTDFARSQRQQKIIQAVKEKLTKLNFITDAGKINNLLSVLTDHFHTNISLDEVFRLYTLGKGYSKENIISQSLDPETRLICSKILEESGAYVLTVCDGRSKEDVADYFKNSFEPKKPQPVVWILDSTNNPERVKINQEILTSAGFTVYTISYIGKVLPENLVYEVNHVDEKLNSDLLRLMKAKITTTPPEGLNITPDKVDAVVILGKGGAVIPESTK